MFSATLEWVAQNNEVVIIDVRGKPKAVILSCRQYEEYEEAREEAPQERMHIKL